MEPAVIVLACIGAVAVGGTYALVWGKHNTDRWQRIWYRVYHPIKSLKRWWYERGRQRRGG